MLNDVLFFIIETYGGREFHFSLFLFGIATRNELIY